MVSTERIFVAAGAVAALLLQLFVAPYLGIFGAVPNVLAAFALTVAVIRSRSFGCVMPFVLGLAFDFVGGGPIGGMAFALTLGSVLASQVFARVDNDSRFMAFALMAAGLLVVELAYAAVLLAGGYNASVLQALAYRALPCFVYDFVLGLVLYPAVARFARPAGAVRAELTQLR